MANIDTSTIEGYESMTAEEKVKALESFNMPDPDYSGYVKKDVFDKTASELAQSKKDLKARMSEDEVKQAEYNEALAKWKSQAESLQREKDVADNKAKLIGIGYDEALATATATAMVEGDLATVLKNQQTFVENVKKIAKGEAMAQTPTPAGKADEGGKTITKEQFDKMPMAERQALYESNRELYDEFTK